MVVQVIVNVRLRVFLLLYDRLLSRVFREEGSAIALANPFRVKEFAITMMQPHDETITSF